MNNNTETTEKTEQKKYAGILLPGQLIERTSLNRAEGINDTGWTLFPKVAVEKFRLKEGHSWKTFPAASDGSRDTMYGIQGSQGKPVEGFTVYSPTDMSGDEFYKEARLFERVDAFMSKKAVVEKKATDSL